MLSRKTKATFYILAGPLMKCNGWLYRYLRAPNGEPCKVHLGPGQRKYIPGWINLDANMFTGKCDVWVDLRNRLPFRPSTIDALYSHHVVEHLPNLELHFREAYRCLKPGGVYRIGVPHGDSAIKKFIEDDKEWFDDFPDRRRSIGGRFENFIFCRQEHMTILTYSYVDELMTNAGFVNIRQYPPVRETGFPEIFDACLDKEEETDYDCPHTLIVEAQKQVG